MGTDNIHFNVAKNNIPIGSNSLLDFTINVTDSQSINADLSDGENDDGAFQMILVLGNYSEDTDQTTVTHVLFLTYMSENFSKAKNYPRRVSLPQYLASTTAPPTDDIKQSNNEFVEAQSKKHGEAALESNRIKKVTGNVSATTNKDDFKFVEIYGQDGVWESYTLNLRNLIEHTYGEEESKKITHLFALGLESTAVSWNCADDNSASCKIQDISVIEMD